MLETQLQQLRDLLKIHWGFSDFRFGQEEAIRHVLEGRHTIVVMPTGGGKSLIYQLPSLILDGVTIVISPLIALMKDQVDQLTAIGIPATFINSSLPLSEAQRRMDDIRRGAYKLVYIAPERFYSQQFIDLLDGLHIALFAIDEAHCISEWGHDFRPSYLRLREVIKLVGNPTVAALTATATPEVRDDIIKQLGVESPRVVVTGFDRPNLRFGVVQASDAQKFLRIRDVVQSIEGSGIIYAGTRQKVDSLLEYLLENGVQATGYHAGMDADDRKAVQDDFMAGRARVIIATNAFGLGINKPDIRFVVHFDMPGTLEAYYQEAGRAGRDGKEAYCIMFHSPADRYLREFFIKGDNPPPQVITQLYDILLSYDSDTILATYSDLMEGLREQVPDMAVGTALKILEREGYIRRATERQGLAFLRCLKPLGEIKSALGSKAKTQVSALEAFASRYADALCDGVEFLPEDIAALARVKRDAVTRLIKKLEEAGHVEYRPPFRGTEINIVKRVRPEELAIDFTALREKNRRELHKLDLVEDYVYHSRCRRKYILDYFEDSTARSCGTCDNCAGRVQEGTHRALDESPICADDLDFEPSVPTHADAAISTKLTQLETYELYQAGCSLHEMAQRRNLKPGTIIQHLVFLLEKGKDIDISRFVDASKQKVIQKAAKKVGADTLTAIKEKVGDTISWDDIRLTLATFKKK